MLRRFKCVLSAALVAVLLFTLFPLASFAADPSIKFSVTKYTLTPEELEEIEPDKEEDVGNYADLYPVPLIVRVAVGGSGKLVGADFYVSYEGDKLQYSRTINYDSIIDDTANMAVSDPQTDTGNRKKINISFFFSEHYALKSQGESIIYLMFYVKKNPNSANKKYFFYGNMDFKLIPENVGYLDNNGNVQIVGQGSNFINVNVANNILTDTPAPVRSLEIKKKPSTYAVNKAAPNFVIPNGDLEVGGIKADGTKVNRLSRDDRGLSSGAYSVNKISLTTPGIRTVTITYKDNISGETITAKFNVNVVDTAGKTVSSLTVTPPTNLYNTVGNPLDTEGLKVVANYTDKTTATITNYTISGYNKDKIGEQTITISLSGKTATFKVYVCPNRGDIDNSGKIDAGDARLVLRYAAKLDRPNEAVIKAMDCDKDGKVNASDARKILRYVAKLDKTF